MLSSLWRNIFALKLGALRASISILLSIIALIKFSSSNRRQPLSLKIFLSRAIFLLDGLW